MKPRRITKKVSKAIPCRMSTREEALFLKEVSRKMERSEAISWKTLDEELFASKFGSNFLHDKYILYLKMKHEKNKAEAATSQQNEEEEEEVSSPSQIEIGGPDDRHQDINDETQITNNHKSSEPDMIAEEQQQEDTRKKRKFHTGGNNRTKKKKDQTAATRKRNIQVTEKSKSRQSPEKATIVEQPVKRRKFYKSAAEHQEQQQKLTAPQQEREIVVIDSDEEDIKPKTLRISHIPKTELVHLNTFRRSPVAQMQPGVVMNQTPTDQNSVVIHDAMTKVTSVISDETFTVDEYSDVDASLKRQLAFGMYTDFSSATMPTLR